MKQRALKRNIKQVEVKPLSMWCETTVSDFCSTCLFAKGCHKYGHFLGKKLLNIMKQQGYPEHNTDSPDCWFTKHRRKTI